MSFLANSQSAVDAFHAAALVQGLLDRVLRRPCTYRSIKFVYSRNPATVIGQAWVSPKIIATNCCHQALKNTVAIASHKDIAAILAKIGIGRRNTRQRATGRLAHCTEGTIFWLQAFHTIEDGLVKGHINHLTLATFLSLMQGHQNADDTMQRGQGIANTDTNPYRHTTRLSA